MEIADPALRSGCNRSYLDLVSQVLYCSTGETDEPHAMAHMAHELGHWPRFHGTSTGHILNLLRFTRDVTSAAALRAAGSGVKAGIQEKRKAGHPLWALSDPYDPAIGGEDFAIMGQAWTDSYWLWNALYDSQVLARHPGSPAESAPYALADAWLYTGGSSAYHPYPDNDVARAWLTGPFRWTGTAEGELTTRILWECASTLDELLPVEREDWDTELPLQDLLTDTARWGDSHQLLARIKLEETPYGLPARLAVSKLGTVSVLEMALLIDFALNPPLPMFGNHRVDRLTWSEFYPPARFVKACARAHGLRTLTRGWLGTPQQYGNAMAYLESASKLPYLRLDGDEVSAFPKVSQSIGGNNAFHQSIISTSAHLLSARQRLPELVLFPRLDRSWRGPDDFLVEPSGRLPLVMQLEGHLLHVPPFGDEQGFRFLEAATVSRLLDCLVNDTQAAFTFSLPEGAQPDHIVDRGITTLADLIDWPRSDLVSCLWYD